MSGTDGDPLLVSSPSAGTLMNWTTLTNDVTTNPGDWRPRLGLSAAATNTADWMTTSDAATARASLLTPYALSTRPWLNVSAVQSDSNVILFASFSSTNYLMTVWKTNDAGMNGEIDLVSQKSTNIFSGSTVGTSLSSVIDDTCPLRDSSVVYFDAGHGYLNCAFTVTASGGHGLTMADVGKTWIDSNSRYCCLWQTNNKNTAIFLARPYTYTGITNYVQGKPPGSSGTLTATTLTIQSGYPGEGYVTTAGPLDISYTSSVAGYNIVPVTVAVTNSYWMDGTPTSLTNEVTGTVLRAQCARSIWPYWKLFSAQVMSVGTQVTGPSLGPWLVRVQDYYFAGDHTRIDEAITVVDDGTNAPTIQAFRPVSFGGPVQAGALSTNYWDGNLAYYMWVPGVSGDTIEFGSPALYHSLASDVNHPATVWKDANEPPAFCVGFISTNTTALATNDYYHAFGFGYDPTYEQSSAASRVPVCNTGALQLYTSRKVYPWVSGPSQSEARSYGPGETARYRGWRSWSVPPGDGLLYKSQIDCGTHWLVVIGWDAAQGRRWVSLPEYLRDNYAVTDAQSDNGTLLSSRTSADGVCVNLTGAPGYMILKVQTQ